MKLELEYQLPRVNGFHLQRDEDVSGLKLGRDVAEVFQKNNLQLYDRFGNRLADKKGGLDQPFSQRAAELVEQSAKQLDVIRPDIQIDRMKFVLPGILGSLLDSGKTISGLYQQQSLDPREDLLQIVLDWFVQPDILGQTIFHVVYGGDVKPSPRAPAYIIPALRAIAGLQSAYDRYRTWASGDALFRRVQNDHASQEEIKQLRKGLRGKPFAEALPALSQAWGRYANSDLDEFKIMEIDAEYHIAQGLPRLVISNTVNSGAKINAVSETDKALMLEARDRTQVLIREFARRYFPNIPQSNLEFRNDLVWEDDFSVRMQLLFLKDFVDIQASAQSSIVQAKNKLADFGKNHIVSSSDIDAIAPSEVYPLLHGYFFSDRSDLPSVQVMERPLIASHQINFMSRSEITFDVIRKAMELSSSMDYIQWLQSRQKNNGLSIEEKDNLGGLIHEVQEQYEKREVEQQAKGRAELVVTVGKSPVYYPANDVTYLDALGRNVSIDDVYDFRLERYEAAVAIAESNKAGSEDKKAMQGKVDKTRGLLCDINLILAAIDEDPNIAEEEYRELLLENFGNSERKELKI